MTWITVATPSFASIEQIDSVLAQLDGPPDGMEARYIGTAADGTLRVVSLWQSKEHAGRFFAEKLGPAVAKALGPEPVGASDLLGIDIKRSYVSEPVA
ncbi:MAG TPA: hypothetical protein VG795_09170 [Acidimicrobiia bacterium]|jgi:hypothetical protein|nr:hypothetical protein [Acidimicrobiia bacterium]